MALSLAQRSREIFGGSKVEEKRQLLNFVIQSLELKDQKLSVKLREPFKNNKGHFPIREVSGELPMTGLEPAPCCQE